MCGHIVTGNREDCSRYEYPRARQPYSVSLGLARELLLTTVSGPHTLILSAPILIEVRRVLNSVLGKPLVRPVRLEEV